MQYYLACFDVHHDRLRYRVVKELMRHGLRVQYSVFELAMRDATQMRRLRGRLNGLCRRYEDPANIRFYRMSRNTLHESFSLDGSEMMDYPAVIVV